MESVAGKIVIYEHRVTVSSIQGQVLNIDLGNSCYLHMGIDAEDIKYIKAGDSLALKIEIPEPTEMDHERALPSEPPIK